MPPQVIWTAKAEKVLTAVAIYLRDMYGDDYAERYLSGVRNITRGLADHPSKGRPVDKRRFRRRWNINSHHYLLYEPTDSGIKVVAMLSIKQGF